MIRVIRDSIQMKKIISKPLAETFYRGQLECGLPVMIIPKKGQTKKTAVVSTLYGSTDNRFIPPGTAEPLEVPPGIAHFLEHQLFKKADGDIGQEFAKYGAYYNANTGYHTTNYFFTGTDNFPGNLGILMRLTSQPYFSEANVTTEKLIIEQELRMYADMPDIKIYQNLMKNLYHIHPVNIEIGGTVESVRTITHQMLERCYRIFYHPDNMVLAISGDVKPDETLAVLNKTWDMKYAPNADGVKRLPPDEPEAIKSHTAEESMAVARPHLLIGYKDTQTGLKHKALLIHSLINDMLLDLLFGHSTTLYNRLYEDGLIDDHFGASYNCYETYGFTIINAETDQPEALYQRILKEIGRAKNRRFKNRDLDRLKRKFLGKFVWAFNSPEAIAMMFSAYYFHKINPFDIPGYIKKITLKDIREQFIRHLDEKYHSISVVKPVESATKAQRHQENPLYQEGI